MSDRDQIVMGAVRQADPDRYLATLYAPEAKRPALFALYAFNAEIAGIRDRIREALPGEVRLQWWREVIDSGSPRAADGHPVAEALLAAIEAHNLPRAAFDNYLEARLFDLFNDPMPSRTDLEGYCGETAAALIQLAALVLEGPEALKHADAAGHAGCAQAIAGLLRLLPLHRLRGQCFIPRDILDAVGTSPEQLLTEKGEGPTRAIAATVALGSEHVAAFRASAARLPEALRPAFLPVALAPDYLKLVAGQGGDALERSADLAAWKRHWRLFRAAGGHW